MAGRNIEDKIRCSFCGKSQEQVRKMIAQQLIPAIKIGREWRVSKDYLEEFLKSGME